MAPKVETLAFFGELGVTEAKYLYPQLFDQVDLVWGLGDSRVLGQYDPVVLLRITNPLNVLHSSTIVRIVL